MVSGHAFVRSLSTTPTLHFYDPSVNLPMAMCQTNNFRSDRAIWFHHIFNEDSLVKSLYSTYPVERIYTFKANQ